MKWKAVGMTVVLAGALTGCTELEETTKEVEEVVTEEVTPEVTEEKAPEKEPEPVSQAKDTTLGAGKHTVGKHIPAGEYIVSTEETMGNLVVMEGAMPVVNEILGTDEILGVNSVAVEIEEGQEIEISGLNSVLFKVR